MRVQVMNRHGGNIYEFPGVIDFSANINPLGMPKSVIEAAKLGVEASVHYPDTNETLLKKGLAKKEGVMETDIICGNGAAELIFSIIHARKPRRAVVVGPTFLEYETALRSVGCEVISYSLNHKTFIVENHYMELLHKDVDMIFLCNPNNPTGILMEQKFVEKIAKICEENQILFVLDECFLEFCENEKSISMISYTKKYRQLFLLKAFTKLYAMPGLRLGYGITSNQQLLQEMKSVMQPWSVSVPAQFAGVAALKEIEYVNETKQYIKRERTFLYEELKKGLVKEVFLGSANFLFFFDTIGLDKQLLERGFLIRNCSNYVGLKEGYYRIAVRTTKENKAFICALRAIKGMV